MVTYSFNTSTQEAEQAELCEFKSSNACIVSSSQGYTVSKMEKKKSQYEPYCGITHHPLLNSSLYMSLVQREGGGGRVVEGKGGAEEGEKK